MKDTTLKDSTFLTDQRQHEQRRKVRLLQVRKLSKEAAEKVRHRVRTGQVRQVEKVGQQELQKVFFLTTKGICRLPDFENHFLDFFQGKT